MKKSEALHILGISNGATDDEIKQAHRQKIRQNHPDRFTDPAEKRAAEESTKLINEARDVLTQGKWDPEEGPRHTTYSAPYAHPYNAPRDTSYDPFEGFPFTVNYVWTSWEDIPRQNPRQSERPHTHQTSHSATWSQTYAQSGSRTRTRGPYGRPATPPYESPFEYDPFFAEFVKTPTQTPEEALKETRQQLHRSCIATALKLGLLALCALMGALAIGMFIYVIATILIAVMRETKGCASFLAIPFLFLFGPIVALWTPRLGASVTASLFVFFGFALAYDIGTIRRQIQQVATLRERVKVSQ